MKSIWNKVVIVPLLLLMVFTSSAWASRAVPCPTVSQAPVVDGDGMDAAWSGVKPLSIKDAASGSTILLRTVRSEDAIYFLVQYPDPAQNFLHKPWIWNAKESKYETGPHREDTFVFKWNMMEEEVDLSNFSDDSYRADVWYWKANRTNPAGYSDDKTQILGDQPIKKSKALTSKTGKTRHLARYSDAGKPAYRELKSITEHQGDTVDRYPQGTPEGSRGDVQAKGVWKGGFWVVEFARKLDTGHEDDVRFDPASGKEYQFGVSMFSLYGKPHDPNSPNYYGRGRISEPLVLKFQ